MHKRHLVKVGPLIKPLESAIRRDAVELGNFIFERYSDADVAWVQRALRVAALPESWKEYFRQRLEQISTSTDDRRPN